MNTTQTFAQECHAILHRTDGESIKEGIEAHRKTELCSRLEFVKYEIERILEEGPNADSLDNLEHDFQHVQSLLQHMFQN